MPQPAGARAWLSLTRERLLVACVLAAYLVALGFQAWHVGLTYDEPTHMLGAYLYWLNRPTLSPDFAPLIHILTGWIPLALGMPLFPDIDAWQTGVAPDIASQMLDRLRSEQIRELFYLMRLVVTVFPILTALLIWHWARLLFGSVAGLLLLLAAVLLPTPLAHGCLLKNDLAATFSYLLFAFCAWRFWLAPGRRTSLALAAAVLLGILAKLSLLITFPLAVLVVGARLFRSQVPPSRWLPFSLGAIVLVPYLGLLAAYKLDAPFPSDLARGLTALRPHLTDTPTASYFLGEVRIGRVWAYYPVALAIKTPIALQALFTAGLLLLALRRSLVLLAFLLAPGLLYLGLAMQANLQLGVRLVLPAWPFAVLVAGLAVERAVASRAGRAALAVLLAWLAVASLSIYPHGIAYFNEWVGGPRNGWKYLADSNVDWGQNLPDLAAYIRRHRVRHLKLYFFGHDKLHRYGIEKQVEALAPPWSPSLVSETRLRPQPGLYAISASLLAGYLFAQPYRDYFAFFRSLHPIATPGYSVLIYRVE